MSDLWLAHLDKVEKFSPGGSYLHATYKQGVIACDVMGTLLVVDHHSEDKRNISERELPLNQPLIDFLLKLQKAGWEVVVFTHDIFPKHIRVDRETRNSSNSFERAFKRTGLSDIFSVQSKRDLMNYENVYFDLLIDDMYYLNWEIARNEAIIKNFITPQKVVFKDQGTSEEKTYMSHGSINLWNPLDPEVIAFLQTALDTDYVIDGPQARLNSITFEKSIRSDTRIFNANDAQPLIIAL